MATIVTIMIMMINMVDIEIMITRIMTCDKGNGNERNTENWDYGNKGR